MELNEKLARWAGFEPIMRCESWSYVRYPDGGLAGKLPNFTESLDACFKWLVPKLFNYELYKGLEPGKPVRGRPTAKVWFSPGEYARAFEDTQALALCRAIEQLIDNEKKENA